MLQDKRELRFVVGVIAERRKAASRWADDYWIPTAIIEGATHLKPGEKIRETEKATSYFMDFAEIHCHASDAEAYVHNFESEVPAIYVVLRKDDENEHELPYFVHAVTVSPYEAQDYCDNSEDIVERVQMPVGMAAALMEFTDTHYKEEVFKKRKRKDFKSEKHQFGKEPIFLERSRPDNEEGLDD